MFVQVTGYPLLPTQWTIVQVQHTSTLSRRPTEDPLTAHLCGRKLSWGRGARRTSQVTGSPGVQQHQYTALLQHTPGGTAASTRAALARAVAGDDGMMSRTSPSSGVAYSGLQAHHVATTSVACWLGAVQVERVAGSGTSTASLGMETPEQTHRPATRCLCLWVGATSDVGGGDWFG